MGNELVVLIPVKRLDHAKSRLAGRLTQAARSDLMLQMLARVLEASSGSALVGHSLVVSPDAAVRAYAESAGACAIDESRPGDGQNPALEWGRVIALERWDPAALLVLSADLPLITSADIDAIARLGTNSLTIVLAPDRWGTGTNALYQRPPDLLPFRFGPDSRQAHRDEASSRQLSLAEYQSIGTSTDLDLPDDLDWIERVGRAAGDGSRV